MGTVSTSNPINSPSQNGSTSSTGGTSKTTSKSVDLLETTPSVNSFKTLANSSVTSSIVLDTPITVSAYSETVGSATDANEAQEAINELVNSDMFSKLAQGLVDKSEVVVAIGQAVTILGNQIEAVETDENNQITTLQDQITATSSAIQNQNTEQTLDDYNTAVSTYNTAITTADSNYASAVAAANSLPADQQAAALQAATATKNASYASALSDLNTAIDDYNTAAKADNTANNPSIISLNKAINTFNTQQAANNQTINGINAKLTALGLTNIPNENFSESDYSLSLQTNLPHVANVGDTIPEPTPSSVSLPQNNLTPITVETSTQFVGANLNAVLQRLNADNNFGFNESFNIAQNLNNQRKSRLSSQSGLPDAYIGRHVTLAPFSVINAGGGSAEVQLGSATVGQAGSAISNAILKALTLLKGVNIPLETTTRLSNFTAEISKVGGLIAAKSGLLLGAAALSSTDNNMAFGITNAQVVASMIQSGVVADGVKQIVEDGLQGTDQATVDKTTDVATAIVNQQLVQLALAEASNDLGTPGLYGQVLGNADNATAAGLAQASTSPTTIQQTLNDPSNQLYLKNSLTQNVAQNSNLNTTQAQALIDQAVNYTIKSQATTADDLHTALVAAFNGTTLSPTLQSNLVQQAQNIISTEQNAQSVISGNLLDQNIAQQILTNALQGASINNAETIASDAISNIAKNISITNDEQYRLDLEDQLKQEGIKDDIASTIAKSTVDQASSTNPQGILNPIFVQPDPLPSLTQQIHDKVYNVLSNVLDPTSAHEVATSAAATFVGTPEERSLEINSNKPPSLLEIYKASDQTLDNYGLAPSASYTADQVRDYVKKTNDSLTTLSMIYDPGKLLLHSGATSLFSAGVGGDSVGKTGPVLMGSKLANPVIAA